ncbi:molybdenum cofactor biosynthesis protein MoaE [Lysobacter sp. CCNWLW3]|uniref:molybdenum cofactor biosynthesis protein MoaE n=1 Tax=unclassified Lysobacter TaxID=2635362 RepID=UPI002FD5AB5A
MARFRLSETAFDPAATREWMMRDEAGAYASFEGWVRDHHQGRAVLGLRYESYALLAEREGEKILAEALERFAIVEARCIHRVGELGVGELAVWVGVSAAHRDAAFAACRYIIDETKARVPIWKHERYVEGDAGWLHPEPPAQG